MTSLVQVLLGAVIMGDVIAALFFVRFWKVTDDRFFLFFAASFIAIAVSRVVVDEGLPPVGYEPWGYLLRILSYVFIIAGILYKNTVKANPTVATARPTPIPQEHFR